MTSQSSGAAEQAGARPNGSSGPPRRLIARQLGLGFAAVSVVAIAMCALLLSIIYDVSGHIAQMRDDESSIRQGKELATTVRELTLQASQVVMTPGQKQLSAYGRTRDRLRQHLQQLTPKVPADERWRVPELGTQTQRLHDVLMFEALPALEAGDEPRAQQAYRKLQAAGARAARQADALSRATAERMVHAHIMATDATRVGLIGGGLLVTLVLVLSVTFTLRLRAQVLHPLVLLTQAAERFGRGDLERRVPALGPGELGALGEAMNHMADELSQRERRLLQNERMAAIGQLAAGIAHEMNNPIGIMRGYLKTMSVDDDPTTLREELAIVDEEAGHCQRIAGDLLSYARSGELEFDRLEMDEFVREAVERFAETPQGIAKELANRITVDVEPGALEADGAKLRQVLFNLLQNARQAAPEGIVTLTGRRRGQGYQLTLEDEGPGIAVEDQSRIFEPFFSKRRGGSGLGLAVCQGIVRAHGGAIEVEAGAVGARFVVTLPGARVSTTAPADLGAQASSRPDVGLAGRHS